MMSYAERCVEFVDRLTAIYPGILDAVSEINGADLVDTVCSMCPERDRPEYGNDEEETES